ncbi:alpha/beta hydrolase fold [Alloactinosynnema sp. L-07]|uniref:alpha/beta fold hydrolase n=1 Tax=Alloactinosynnema sp. L-07 TaxID=1653480 RepID=UPI00065EEF89|nr:alpha/beta hydrolase [Alloactinosynnema sp. L-07]CRK57586.1 alpha/beta hydrolase fold [Alloactinosynnema sp. L-07]
MPIADLGDRKLHYIRRGHGVPLLLIQGMGGHHGLWGEPFLTRLERDFDVVAFDHRGISHSDPAEAGFTIADLADDTARVLTAIGWDDAHVMGISMGGMVAQELAVRHPERIRTLTLGCTYAGPEGGTLDGPGPMRMMLAANAGGDVGTILRAAYEANLSPTFRADETRFSEFVEVTLSQRVPSPVIMMQLQAVARHDAEARLKGVKIPTLVVHGTEDEMITPKNGDHVASLVPDAKLAKLRDVGHLFWWEQPDRAAELLREHCR